MAAVVSMKRAKVALLCALAILLAVGTVQAAQMGILPIEEPAENQTVDVGPPVINIPPIDLGKPDIEIEATTPVPVLRNYTYNQTPEKETEQIVSDINVTSAGPELKVGIDIELNKTPEEPKPVFTLPENVTVHMIYDFENVSLVKKTFIMDPQEGISVEETTPTPSETGAKSIPSERLEVRYVVIREDGITEAYVNERGNPKKLEMVRKNGKVALSCGGVSVETNRKLEFSRGGLYIKDEEENRFQINTLPSTASEKVKEFIDDVQDSELGIREGKTVYEFRGSKKGKLLWFIPVTVDVEVEVNADTGDIENVVKPWWSFLVF